MVMSVFGCSGAQYALATVESAPVKRQSPLHIAQRPPTKGKIVYAVEGVGMLWGKHALAAVEPAHVERQSLRCVAQRLQA
jgi:hypothetical protein